VALGRLIIGFAVPVILDPVRPAPFVDHTHLHQPLFFFDFNHLKPV